MTPEQITTVLKAHQDKLNDLIKRIAVLEEYIKLQELKKEAEKHPKDWRII
jgi:hypothetical protein